MFHVNLQGCHIIKLSHPVVSVSPFSSFPSHKFPRGWSRLHPPSKCRGRATRTDWPSTWLSSHHRVRWGSVGFPMGRVYLYISNGGILVNQKVTYLMYQVCHFYKEKIQNERPHDCSNNHCFLGDGMLVKMGVSNG